MSWLAKLFGFKARPYWTVLYCDTFAGESYMLPKRYWSYAAAEKAARAMVEASKKNGPLADSASVIFHEPE